MLEIFTYGFIQRALFTGISVGTACALLGVFLVLRRYALIGHGLTHVAFGGVAVGLLFFRQPFWATLIVTLLSLLRSRMVASTVWLSLNAPSVNR